MKTADKISGMVVGGIFTWIAVVIILAVGWIINVVSLCQCDFEPSYKAEVIRGIGVLVPPVGGIVGYIDIEDGE